MRHSHEKGREGKEGGREGKSDEGARPKHPAEAQGCGERAAPET